MDARPALPLPPENFERLALEVVTVDVPRLVRLAWQDSRTHLQFRAEPRNRFDAPDGTFGVLYAGFDVLTCFMETVYRSTPASTPPGEPVVLSESRHLVPRRVLHLTPATPATTARPLRLIRLIGTGLSAARTDGRLCTADDYATTQHWAKALHAHPVQADGLHYVSRFLAGEGECVALFDRCAPLLGPPLAVPLLDHPDYAVISDRLGFATEP